MFEKLKSKIKSELHDGKRVKSAARTVGREVVKAAPVVARGTEKVATAVGRGVGRVAGNITREYRESSEKRREARNENVREPFARREEVVEHEPSTRVVYIREKSRPLSIHIRSPEEVFNNQMLYGKKSKDKMSHLSIPRMVLPPALRGTSINTNPKKVKMGKPSMLMPSALKGVNMGLGVPKAAQGVWGMDGITKKGKRRR